MLLIVATSFGEVDWLLPVLHTFKRKHPEWKIISVFGHETVFQLLMKNTFLSVEFEKISDANILHTNLENYLTSEAISSEQIKIIMKDFNQDSGSPFKYHITNRFPHALVVNFPHSNYVYSNAEIDPVVQCGNPNGYSIHDIFLLSSPNDVPYWSSFVDRRKIRALGYPVFDDFWIDMLLRSSDFIESKEVDFAKKAKKAFFFISRHPHPVYLSQEDYQYLVQALMEEVFSIDGSFLLIKLHPRENLALLRQILSPYDKSRYMISDFHLTQLSSIADVVISLWSSGIMNALSVKKPVIEFFRFGENNPEWRKTAAGKKSSTYRELGLSVPADTQNELSQQINSAISGKSTSWKNQIEAFGKHCRFNSRASEDIVDCLIQEMTRKDSASVESDFIPRLDKLLERQMAYGEKLAADGRIESACEYFQTLDALHPNNENILNNIGSIYFQLGNLEEAARHFQKSLRQNPNTLDAAINLVDLHLLQGHHEAALDSALTIMANSKNKAAIFDALQERPFSSEILGKLKKTVYANTKTDSIP